MIAPFALGVALVGLMESLLTANLVDEITDTHSNKTRESWAQGVANMLRDLRRHGRMCRDRSDDDQRQCVRCPRPHLNVLRRNLPVPAGRRVGDFVGTIPMAALVAMMIMVAIGAFDWHSVRPSTLKRMPKSETFVMVATVALVLVTHNLAIGVVGGVLVASVLFVRRVAHFVTVTRSVSDTADVARYVVEEDLFFPSSNDLTSLLSYSGDSSRVVIDLSRSHVWDASTVAALNAIETKYAALGKTVEIVGMNESSERMRGRFTGGFE